MSRARGFSVERFTMIPLFSVPEPEKPPVEKKKRGRKEDEEKSEQRKKAAVVEESLIAEVYEYWLMVMRPEAKRVPGLDEMRRRKIGWAIHDYGVSGCKQAIDGCAASDWHMGRNSERKRFDSIELIFRNQQKVERFMEMSPHAEVEE